MYIIFNVLTLIRNSMNLSIKCIFNIISICVLYLINIIYTDRGRKAFNTVYFIRSQMFNVFNLFIMIGNIIHILITYYLLIIHYNHIYIYFIISSILYGLVFYYSYYYSTNCNIIISSILYNVLKYLHSLSIVISYYILLSIYIFFMLLLICYLFHYNISFNSFLFIYYINLISIILTSNIDHKNIAFDLYSNAIIKKNYNSYRINYVGICIDIILESNGYYIIKIIINNFKSYYIVAGQLSHPIQVGSVFYIDTVNNNNLRNINMSNLIFTDIIVSKEIVNSYMNNTNINDLLEILMKYDSSMLINRNSNRGYKLLVKNRDRIRSHHFNRGNNSNNNNNSNSE